MLDKSRYKIDWKLSTLVWLPIATVSLLFVSACCGRTGAVEAKQPRKPMDMDCVRIKTNGARGAYQEMIRCENKEVICYTNQQYRGSGISCKWKGE